MPEEIKTAETSGVNPQGDSNADVAKQQAEGVNDVEFTDTPEAEAGQQPKSTEQKVTQTREQNSENARRRREAERQRELKATREKAIIEALNGKNPFTGEEMKDSADVDEYLTMKDIEKSGGDPLADFSKFQKQKERQRAAEAAAGEQQAEWFRRDRESFSTKYPDVNLEQLIQNRQFQLFASGKVGALPLTEIYEGFVEVASEYEKKAKQMAKQMLANRKASPGALSSPAAPDTAFFTKEQVQKMTEEEVSKNYDRIRASMRHWKY